MQVHTLNRRIGLMRLPNECVPPSQLSDIRGVVQANITLVIKY